MLTKEDIRDADDIQTEKVPCPEWRKKGQPAHEAFLVVRGLSATERDRYEASLVEAKRKGAKVNLENMRSKLITYGVIDDVGNLFFSEADVAWLGQKSAAPVDRLYEAIQRLSGMTQQDMEEILKNLDKVPSGDSC